MRKKKKLSLPGVMAYPNTLLVVCGSLLGLAFILSMEPKEEAFAPAYEEKTSLTQSWDEHENIVLAGTGEGETEILTPFVLEVTKAPVVRDNDTDPEEGTGEKTEPDVATTPVDEPEKMEVQENTGGEDTDMTPEQDTTSDTDVDEPDEVIHFTENVTKEDVADTKPKEKPEAPEDTKNPDKEPDYGEGVPVAGEPENENTGKVYDPVFGWITTGEAVSDSIDNDGSLDKQVGIMGK